MQEYPQDSLYLVAVSGGKDSVALLHKLSLNGYSNLVVCHLNHALRGKESDQDAEFVAKLAKSYGYQFEGKKIDVESIATKNKESIEVAARNVRYSFFAEIARKYQTDTIFVGHHADDQVETLLFNLCRGTGTCGLGGMEPESSREIDGVRLRIIRPMLGVWRAEIDKWVKDYGLQFREDSTNSELEYTRNKVRHKLVPLIEEIFPNRGKQSILRASNILRVENEYMQSETLRFGESIPAEKLEVLSKAIQRRSVYTWLTSKISNISFKEVELILSLLSRPNGKKVNLPKGWHAIRRKHQIFLLSPNQQKEVDPVG